MDKIKEICKTIPVITQKPPEIPRWFNGTFFWKGGGSTSREKNEAATLFKFLENLFPNITYSFEYETSRKHVYSSWHLYVPTIGRTGIKTLKKLMDALLDIYENPLKHQLELLTQPTNKEKKKCRKKSTQ